jgi:hypothetical protein
MLKALNPLALPVARRSPWGRRPRQQQQQQQQRQQQQQQKDMM